MSGKEFKKSLTLIFPSHSNLSDLVKVKGFGPWNKLEWGEEYKDEEKLWWDELFKLGIFYSSEHFVMWSHKIEDVMSTIEKHEVAFWSVNECRKFGIVKDKVKEIENEN